MSSPTATGTHSSSAASSSSFRPHYRERTPPPPLQPAFNTNTTRYVSYSTSPHFHQVVEGPPGYFSVRPYHRVEDSSVPVFSQLADAPRELPAFYDRNDSPVHEAVPEAHERIAAEAVLPHSAPAPPQLQPRSEIAHANRPRRYLRPVVVPMQRTYLVPKPITPPIPTQRGRKRDADSISADRAHSSHAVASPLLPTITAPVSRPLPKRRRVQIEDRDRIVRRDVRHETSTLVVSERVRDEEVVEEQSGQMLEDRGVMAVGDADVARRADDIESPLFSEEPDVTAATTANFVPEQHGQVTEGQCAMGVGTSGPARRAYVIESHPSSEHEGEDASTAIAAAAAAVQERGTVEDEAPIFEHDGVQSGSNWRRNGEQDGANAGNRVRVQEGVGLTLTEGARFGEQDGRTGVVAGENGGVDGATNSTSSYSLSSSSGGDYACAVEPTAAPLERAPEVFIANVWVPFEAGAVGFGFGPGVCVGSWHDMGSGSDRGQ